MRRPWLSIFAALSLLLAVIVGMLWARSTVMYSRYSCPHAAGAREWSLVSAGGVLSIETFMPVSTGFYAQDTVVSSSHYFVMLVLMALPVLWFILRMNRRWDAQDREVRRLRIRSSQRPRDARNAGPWRWRHRRHIASQHGKAWGDGAGLFGGRPVRVTSAKTVTMAFQISVIEPAASHDNRCSTLQA